MVKKWPIWLGVVLLSCLSCASLAGYLFLDSKIMAGGAQITAGESQIRKGQQMLAEGKARLAGGKQTLSTVKTVYGPVKQLPVMGMAVTAMPVTSLLFLGADRKISEGEKRIAAGEKQVRAGEGKLFAGRQRLSTGVKKLALAKYMRTGCGVLCVLFLLGALWLSLKLYKKS